MTPRPVTTLPDRRSLPIFPVGPLSVLEGCSKVSPEPSLLQAKQPQLSEPVLIGEVFQPPIILVALLWTRSNSSMSFFCWGPQS